MDSAAPAALCSAQLYGARARLEREDWVEPLPTQEQRRPYRLTTAGQQVLREQVAAVGRVVSVARRRIATA